MCQCTFQHFSLGFFTKIGIYIDLSKLLKLQFSQHETKQIIIWSVLDLQNLQKKTNSLPKLAFRPLKIGENCNFHTMKLSIFGFGHFWICKLQKKNNEKNLFWFFNFWNKTLAHPNVQTCIFRYHMVLRTSNQKRLNDKAISKATGVGIAFHILGCAGRVSQNLLKNFKISSKICFLFRFVDFGLQRGSVPPRCTPMYEHPSWACSNHFCPSNVLSFALR